MKIYAVDALNFKGEGLGLAIYFHNLYFIGRDKKGERGASRTLNPEWRRKPVQRKGEFMELRFFQR